MNGKLTLTPKQAQVLNLLSRGLTMKDVARKLGITLENAHNRLRVAYKNNGLVPYSRESLYTMIAMYVNELRHESPR